MKFLPCAKLAVPELGWQAVDTLVQFLGGRGYIETNEASQMLRDIRILRVFEGPTEAPQDVFRVTSVEPPTSSFAICKSCSWVSLQLPIRSSKPLQTFVSES
ncbi:MAG UNVERIFIED_CONTAM: hypothetical protein LVT10_22630 [Anaerolineae bacterium]